MSTAGATPRSAWVRLGLCHLGYLVAYLVAALWARELNIDDTVLIWFPPAGVALAGLYLFGVRLLPTAVAAEVLSTSLVFDTDHLFGPAPLAVNSVALPVAYYGAAHLLRLREVDPHLRRVRDLVGFVAIAVVGGSAMATVAGIGTQIWAGTVDASDALSQAGVFFVGDVVGIAAITPTLFLVISALRDRRVPELSDRPSREGDPVVLLEYLVPPVAALALMSVGSEPMQFLYLVLIPVAAVALRHGIVGATVTTAGACAVMTVGADLQATGTLERSDFQALMAVTAVVGLTIGTVETQRLQATRRHRRLSAIIEATPDLVGTAELDGSVTYLNPVGRQLLGIPSDHDLHAIGAFDFYGDELSLELLAEGMRAAAREGTWTGDNVLRTHDGRLQPVSQVLIVHRDHKGDVEQYSTVCRDVAPQRQLEDQLRRAVLYDDRTGLPNRALLVEQLGRWLRAPGRDLPVALLLVDLDRFRRVNEVLGFSAGDDVLARLAARVRDVTRPQDVVARHGGDLFAVVLDAAEDEYAAAAAADRLGRTVSEPLAVDGRELVVTASVGVAVAGPDQTDPLDVIRTAEVALHRAKEDGGGTFRVFDQDLDRRSRMRLELETHLRRGIAGEEWSLHYQPIVEARTRRIVSCEALLRWTHPERGAVPPAEVIAVAESTELIVPLGREILCRACKDLVGFAAEGFDLRVSVNVSQRQLAEPGFADEVAAILADTGAAAGSLVLEVTETVLAREVQAVASVLGALRDLGCHVAMDDFGTGYSSLATLRDLPIDVLKLDRSFITGLPSPQATTMVEAIIHLARSLELQVVAEGVEEPEQLEALVAMGCERIQGFVISRPCERETFLDLVRGQLTTAG
jgi:diguanylate cyclase (GGDEF)-like protein/PAS domain S-box-containing protein